MNTYCTDSVPSNKKKIQWNHVFYNEFIAPPFSYQVTGADI